MLKSELWRSLHNKFELRSKQLQGKTEDRWLRAFVEYNRALFSVKERKALDRGLWCLLDKPEYWVWRLSKGPNSSFRAQFETLATRAGGNLHLQPRAGISLGDFWLDHVFFHLRRRSSDQFSSADQTGACIRNICQASAIFCSYLEQNALEIEHRATAAVGKRKKSPRRAISAASPKRSLQRRATSVDEGDKKFRDEEWLRAQRSLSQRQAGLALGLSDRSIRALVADHKLHKTPKSRIAVDGPFWSEFHKRHSAPH